MPLYMLETIERTSRVAAVFAEGRDRVDRNDLEYLEEAGLMDRGVCDDEFGHDSLQKGEDMWTFNEAGTALVKAIRNPTT